ncbi:MAG TPA: adenine phosphoribosyltransferase [Planctomycetota bacterium]|nr:adenine phosphoribosyltransferase [Planctomycetota bacterium]
MTDLANKVKALIRDVPNFPKKGIIFKDITPVLQDATTFSRIIAALEAYGRKRGTELVAGIESRGFLFGAAVAARLEVGLIPIRKKDKLPWKTVAQSYDLEYGKDTMEIHKDAVKKKQRVLVVDDVLATGGTLVGACKLVEKVGGVIAGTTCLLELTFLKGQRKLRGRDFYSIVQY